MLESLTSPELAEGGPSTLLVPLGATEQHGPHLPLGTDTDIALAWANRVADELASEGTVAVVAPPLPYGSSGEHQMFLGTLSIGRDALKQVLIELTRSASNGFDRVLFLSGHAGNLEPVVEATTQLRVEGHRVHHVFPAWPGRDLSTIDAHAGRTETALMLHLHPERVRMELVSPGDIRPLSELMPTLIDGGVAAVSPSGVLGDPTEATAEEGRELFEALVERTVLLLVDAGSSDSHG